MATSVRRGEPYTPGDNQSTTSQEPIQRNPADFNWFGEGILYGVIGAVVTAVILFVTADADGYQGLGWKFISLFGLGAVVYYSLVRYEKFLYPDMIFNRGVTYGLFVTLIAAFTLLIINTLVFIVTGGRGQVDMLSYQVNSVTDFMVAEGIWMFVTLVFGGLFTFIGLQFVKTTAPAEDHQADSGGQKIVVVED